MSAAACLLDNPGRIRSFILLLFLVSGLSSQAQTLYSYQSGSWNNPDVWTTDPGGTTLAGSRLPVSGDAVVILPSRIITLTADVTLANLSISIREGGTLDASDYRFTETLTVLAGNGIFRLSSANFPSAASNTLVTAGGGTVEYCNAADFSLPTQALYFNLNINTPGITATQLSDITINGSLTILAGNYRINDESNTRRTLVVYGGLMVNPGSSITIGTGNTTTTSSPAAAGTGGVAPYLDYYTAQSHRVEVHGNFTNDGTVRFTNQAFPVYNAFPSNGFASVFFRGLSDNILTCNGTTDFYNIIVDKGAGRLSVNSSGYDKFRIFGANTASAFAGSDANNPNIRKALWIRQGTLQLNGYVFVPSLAETTGESAAFCIPADGALVLGGPDVIVMGTIDDYSVVNLAYGVSGGTGAVNGVTAESPAVLSDLFLYGKLQINSGYFYTGSRLVNSGTISSQFILNSGIADIGQFYSVAGGTTTYSQAGGLLILRGRFGRNLQYTDPDALISSIGDPARLNTARTDVADPSAATFSIDQDASSFIMEGGTIDIYDVSGSSGTPKALEINSEPANSSVTGGIIRVIIITGTVFADADYGISSKSSIHNLDIIRKSGSSSAVLLNIPARDGVAGIASPPLRIQNDLNLDNTAVSGSAVLNAGGYEVATGGDFRIESGAVYTPGDNRTVLNGAGSQSFINAGTITNGLHRLVIDKLSGTATLGSNFLVRDSLVILGGTLDDGSHTLEVAGNVLNAGVHTGTGKIQLNGTTVQYLSTVTGGSSVLGNLEAANTSGVAGSVGVILQAPLSLNSLALVSERLFYIGSHMLTIGAGGIPDGQTYNASRMISTNGLSSDGGLKRYISSSLNGQTVLYPVGCPGGPRATAVAYFPGRMYLGTVTSEGYFTVVPVSGYHPSCQVNRTGEALDFYWKTRIRDLVTSGTRNLQFNYRANIPNSYNDPYYLLDGSSAWGSSKGVNNSPVLNFPESIGISAGDFTAGKNNPFRDPATYFSRQSGAWNSFSTWSLTGHTGAAGTSLPSDFDNVVIGGVAGLRNDSVTVTANGITAAIITINGSYTSNTRSPVLNIQGTTGHLVEIIRGAGKFCTSTAVLPSPTDYGSFLQNDTAVFQYYGGSYTLPAPISSYPNLIISGNNIKTLNTGHTTVRRNLMIADEVNTGNVLSLNAASGDLTVLGDLRMKHGGVLGIPATDVQRNISIYGDIDFTYGNTADPNAIESSGSGTVHRLYFHGRYIRSGASNLIFNPTATNKIDLYFSNAGSVIVTPGEGTFNLNRLFIQKEAITDTVYFRNNFILNESSNSTAQKSLTLSSGTLILSDNTNGSPSTINLNLTSGGTSTFSINSASALILRNGSMINITGNTSGSGIRLDGLLKSEDNSEIFLADGSAENTGYIEYTGSGNASLVLSGSSVMAVSQIRRSLLTSAGLLQYEQKESSSATIYGIGASGIIDPSRAKLEVTGSGSSFRMGGTSTLSLVGGGGTLFGDLYLHPDISEVTGGTIIFGTGVSGQTWQVDASIPLNSVTVNTTGDQNILNVAVNPLVLEGNLALSSAGSTFEANGLDLFIAGNLVNNGVFDSGTGRTTFNGTAQLISGTSDPQFYNLTVQSSSKLTLGRDITVRNDLAILNGIFETLTFSVTTAGNVTNNGSYTSDPAPSTGRLYLNGSAVQQISGTGSFGRTEIDNSAGVRILSSISLTEDLKLSSGTLNIGQYTLRMGPGSYFTGGPFNSTRMIVSDGAFSNGGIVKNFSEGYSGIFIYPAGVSGKFTPAELTVASVGAGSVRVNMVNERHPATFPPYNVLDYYWDVVSNLPSFEGSFMFRYDPANVSGDESQYVAARLIMPPLPGWSKAATGPSTDNVDESTHTIWFSFPSGTDNVGGQYTAGYSSDLPDIIPVYTSNVIYGNWEDPGSWSPEAPPGGPNGFRVIINPGHTIITNGNRRFCYTTTINGTLDAGATYEHNLGTVNGTGSLSLEGAVLPAGDFRSFLGCSGGTLEYGGTTSYTIIADRIDTVRNLLFTGSGTRTLPDKDLVVCNLLRIDGPVLDNYFNRKLTVGGSFELASGTFRSGSGSSAAVVFKGSSVQYAGGFNGASALNNLEISNGAGLVLEGITELKGNLILTEGIITSSASSMLMMISQSGTASEGSPSSFVNGPMAKNQLGGVDFFFPTGNEGRYGKLGLLNPQTGIWEAEYINNTFPDLTVSGMLTQVSSGEYWRIKSPADGKKANIRLRWDQFSEINPAMVTGGIDDIRVAAYNGTAWAGIDSYASGNTDNGIVTTTESITVGNSGHPWFFTLGSVSTVRPSIVTGIPAPVCQCSSPAYLPYLSTTGNPDQYSIDFDNSANAEGFIDVPWSNLPASPVAVLVPPGAQPEIYNAVIRVRVSSTLNESLPYTFSIIVTPDLGWTGSVSTDWNSAGNWSCNILPGVATSVRIPDVPNKPVLASGATGAVYDLTISEGSSLTVSENTLRISGSVVNNGLFTATAGTIEMNGTSPQVLAEGIFSGNTIRDLTVNNSAGVSLQGPLNVTGILHLQSGNLGSGGYLTLYSSAEATALIDGSGTGQVTGRVTMQRYLPSGFGYKYFSSPFQSATVSEFADEVDLAATFPLFYAYDENRWYDIYALHPFYAYTNPAGILNPMAGYSINFGSDASPKTVSLGGIVNNGSYSLTLYNHNHPYAIGRNMVGNPYPSPIDWSAEQGWTKNNIDNALYYFRASTSDVWGGTYSSWVNGVSSDGVASNIIASMQGFLVHVSDGAYPVEATLSLDNRVRVNNFNQPFLSKGAEEERSLIRLTAAFADQQQPDPFVIYLDDKATPGFDNQLDAFKYFNTDITVPNLYSFAGVSPLTIDALPVPDGKLMPLPIGIKTEMNGEVVFSLRDVAGTFVFSRIYIRDALSGELNELTRSDYRVFLTAGEHNSRFSVEFEDMATDVPSEIRDLPGFRAYSSNGIIFTEIGCLKGREGTLILNNLTGQALISRKIYADGHYEFNPGVKTGIYIISFVTGNMRFSERIYIQGQ